MPRPTRLKREGSYWVAWINGKKKSFGNVAKVTFSEAQRKFGEALIDAPDLAVVHAGPVTKEFTVSELVIDYLADCATKHERRTCLNKQTVLRRFERWTLPRLKRRVGTLRAVELTAEDFQRFLDSINRDLVGKEQDTVTAGGLWHYYTELAACWNWASGCKGHPASHLPSDHKPFAILKAPPRPSKELLADDLMTADEVRLVMERSKPHNADEVFLIMHQTGCRPGELARARVKDFDDSGDHPQIVLYKHKNSKRGQSPKPRRVYLPPQSAEIVRRRCAERPSKEAHIFVGPNLKGLVQGDRRVGLDASTIAKIKAELAKKQPNAMCKIVEPAWVATARSQLNEGAKPKEVAVAVGMSVNTIYDLKHGRIWPEGRTTVAKRACHHKAVAEKFGVSRATVQRIDREEIYPSEAKLREARKAKRNFQRTMLPWTTARLDAVFRACRGDGVRDVHTPYAFRDLFISDALRRNVSPEKIARATGTSAKMIERHYGHFHQSDLAAIGLALAEARAIPVVVAMPMTGCDTSAAATTG